MIIICLNDFITKFIIMSAIVIAPTTIAFEEKSCYLTSFVISKPN